MPIFWLNTSLLILIFWERPHDPTERTVIDRISYIYNLKSLIDSEVWPGFTDKRFDLPLVYYTDSACYVANPTMNFIRTQKVQYLFGKGDLTIYKAVLLDSIPFHMETSILFGDSSSAYNYMSPFMKCSSFEITKQFVPDVNSTEQWSTMTLHEYFHGFQLKHDAFLNYFQKNIGISEDSLKRLYKKHSWFKGYVDQENEMLLTALETTEIASKKKLIDSVRFIRKTRRMRTKKELGIDISVIERIYETMEGTARYVEYSLYQDFARKNPDERLLKSDSSYHSYRYFRNYRIENDQWLYLSQKSGAYFYATGFNMVRLFDTLDVDYKARLFNDGSLSLEEILGEIVAK